MTRDEIIRMAREAGFANVRGGLMDNGEISDYWDCWPNQLELFAALVAAAEREAVMAVVNDNTDGDGLCCADDLLAAIRARSEK